MLATRQNKAKAPQGRHLTESRNRQMITETADPHQASVLYESTKNPMVQRWAPVLNKCREIKPKKMGLMSAIFENQYKHMNPQGRSLILRD